MPLPLLWGLAWDEAEPPLTSDIAILWVPTLVFQKEPATLVLIPSVIIGHGVPANILQSVFTNSQRIKHVKSSETTLVPAALWHSVPPRLINRCRASANIAFKSGFTVRSQAQQ